MGFIHMYMYSGSECSFFCNKMFVWFFKMVLRQVLNCISCKTGNVLRSHFRDHFLVVYIITVMSRINKLEKDSLERLGKKSHY